MLPVPIPVSARLTVGRRQVLSRNEFKLTKPWWPFRKNLAPLAKATASSAVPTQPPSTAWVGLAEIGVY